ncbi:MAG: MraZ N-terminal domain containing protein [Clostridia bacterium]|nr:MraZ N-terminal domain containing protein [Clostridia bacterium]
MALMIGKVYHQVDEKNRIRIPAKFKALFPKGETLYFYRRNENRVAIFPESLLEQVLLMIQSAQPRDMGKSATQLRSGAATSRK